VPASGAEATTRDGAAWGQGLTRTIEAGAPGPLRTTKTVSPTLRLSSERSLNLASAPLRILVALSTLTVTSLPPAVTTKLLASLSDYCNGDCKAG
jgi:hypothetical protein